MAEAGTAKDAPCHDESRRFTFDLEEKRLTERPSQRSLLAAPCSPCQRGVCADAITRVMWTFDVKRMTLIGQTSDVLDLQVGIRVKAS
jgi:hypothetical protein